MNPRHAAALALVGWYLLVPPFPHFNDANELEPDTNAPLTRWSNAESFDSAHECERSLDGERQVARKEVLKTEKLAGPSAKLKIELAQKSVAQWNAALCIASDDPRLKEK